MYPYFFSNLDLNNIFFTNVKDINNNIKIIFIKYNDKNKIKNCVFQLPTLINNHYNENNNFEINLKCNNNNNTHKLIDFFNDLDNKIISESKNNITWFNNINDKSNIKYKRIIKDTQTCDTGCINFKLNNYKDFKTKILFNNINYNGLLPSDGKCQIILECYGILINNIKSEFELILRPIILSFKLSYNYTLLDSECDDDNKITNDNVYIDESFINESSIDELVKEQLCNNVKSINNISANDKTDNSKYNNIESDNGESDNIESDNGKSDNDESDNDESDNGEIFSESSDNDDLDNMDSDYDTHPKYIKFNNNDLLFIKSPH